MPTIRDRACDALLRTATDLAVDREEITRRIGSAPRTAPGHDAALGAMWCARWVDSTMLWLSWRLRRSTNAQLDDALNGRDA